MYKANILNKHTRHKKNTRMFDPTDYAYGTSNAATNLDQEVIPIVQTEVDQYKVKLTEDVATAAAKQLGDQVALKSGPGVHLVR